MRWEPYTKNKDISAEKWELIDKVLDLLDPPTKLRSSLRQELKKCSMEGLQSKAQRLSAGGNYFPPSSLPMKRG